MNHPNRQKKYLNDLGIYYCYPQQQEFGGEKQLPMILQDLVEFGERDSNFLG